MTIWASAAGSDSVTGQSVRCGGREPLTLRNSLPNAVRPRLPTPASTLSLLDDESQGIGATTLGGPAGQGVNR